MTTEKWTDVSKWQGDVSAASLQAMQRDGHAGVCVGSWHGLDANPYAARVLARARGLGLRTATYIVVNNRPGAWTVDQARAACGAEWDHCVFHAADVEIKGITEAILQQALDRIVDLDGYPNIYTGAWFWNWWAVALGRLPGLQGGVPSFARYGLWTANYNGRPDLNVPLYGGWDRAIAHQYAGTTHIYGTSVDLNVFDGDWLSLAARRGEEEPAGPVMVPSTPYPVPPKEETEMSSKEYTQLRNWVQTKVHDPIVNRLAALERKVDALVSRPPAPAPAPRTRTYTVKSGDNASAIAQAHGLTLAQLKARNPGKPRSGNWNLIHPGEVFNV